MKLTKKQKNYIKKYAKDFSVSEIAVTLKVPQSDIYSYVKKYAPKTLRKRDTLSDKTINISSVSLTAKIKSFSLRTWLSHNYHLLFLLLFMVIIAYTNSIGNEFVSDDIAGIAQDPNLTNPQTTFVFPPSIQRIAYFFIASVFGKSAAAFRLFYNILPHLGNVCLVFLLLSIISSTQVGFLAASLFAIHPLLSESVVWISAGSYPIYTLLVLTSFLLYIFSVKKKEYLLYSMGFFMLAILFSEKAIVFPLILIAFAYFNKFKVSLDKRLFVLAVPALFLGSLYLSKIPAKIETLQKNYYSDGSFTNPLVQIPVAISSYLELIFWPDQLTLYHSDLVLSTAQFIFKIIVFTLFTLVIAYMFRRNNKVCFWLCFFIISLLPTLTPFGISWIVAERYVYLGSIGMFTAISMGFDYLMKKPKWKSASQILFGVLIILLTVRTIVRNNDWKNQDNLWIAAARTSPSSPNNHNNLGDMYGRHGNYIKAIEEFKRAIALKPNYADAYHNLANTYMQTGEAELAIENYQKAITHNPNLWQSHQNLAIIYFEQEKYEEAAVELQKAISLSPQQSILYTRLGMVYLRQNSKEAAKTAFTQALELNPQDQYAKAGLIELQK
ncbi:MAG: tetratricopeptide repeat protein [Patescibacteria group bacterium]|jgi:Tfp pilus assembly protein PilF